MDPLASAAAAGMRARMESLDMLSNNLANASSAGFKADREFYTLYSSPESANSVDPDLQRMPLIERRWTDLGQGAMQVTGKPLDIAIQGRGFFALSGPNGPVYTRNGNFRLSPAGLVLAGNGEALQLTDGQPLRLTPGDPVEISPNGTVSQRGQALGRINIVDFQNEQVLEKQGSTNFVAPPGAATPVPASAEVRQRTLETSNVSTAEASIRLVSVMRQFEMLQKAVSIGAEMNRKTFEEVAKVG